MATILPEYFGDCFVYTMHYLTGLLVWALFSSFFFNFDIIALLFLFDKY